MFLTDLFKCCINILITIESPKWTDIVQAIAALIGVPVAVFTLYKLMTKDKERESEIASLTGIVKELNAARLESEKRNKNSKKPHITPNIQTQNYSNGGGSVILDLSNSNPICTLVAIDIVHIPNGFNSAMPTSINQTGTTQYFKAAFTYINNNQPQTSIIPIKYTTEEGYIYGQNIMIWLEANSYKYSPEPITLENS